VKRYGLILAIALVIFWLALSGFFMPLLLILGGISILLTLWLCARMKILDHETAPYLFLLPTLGYLVWLGKEIFTANIAVARAVLSPDMKISPTMVRVPMNRKTDIGATMFANSITLTPGTVSVQMDDDAVVVHALLSEMATADDFVQMEERAGFAVGEGTQ
jgi:multicomponent Na+:H+ antiporter subunit E